jgi:putative tricarboxylic transport membrane protein
MKKADQWSGFVLIIIAGLICWRSATLPYGSLRNPGPGFYPLWLGILLGVMSISLIVVVTRQKEGTRILRDILTGEIRWVKIFLVIVALILYGVLMDYVGFLILTFLLLAFLLRAIEPQPWKAVIGWALFGSIGSYLVFEIWMKLRLPKGFLGI